MAVRVLFQVLSILVVITHASRSESWESGEESSAARGDNEMVLASIIDRIISYIYNEEDDECPITCPCFTAEDITETCMGSESCSFTSSVPIQQEIVCGNDTFKLTPFNNQCQGLEQSEPIYTTNAEFSECSDIITMSRGVLGDLNCTENAANACIANTNFTERQNEDSTEFRDESITNTINIDIPAAAVEGLTLDDIVVTVVAGHTRVGDVKATLSHNGMSVDLFGNTVEGNSDCGYDSIFVTITDKATLPPVDLRDCEDVNGTDINAGAALGFGGENAVIGFGGTRRPQDALSTLIDQDVTMINGNWTLTLNDVRSSNIGYFGAWEITFVYLNEEVNSLCESALSDRSDTGTCCDLDENKALCESTLEYCKSSACLVARDNADNLETVVNQLFRAVDLRCFSQ